MGEQVELITRVEWRRWAVVSETHSLIEVFDDRAEAEETATELECETGIFHHVIVVIIKYAAPLPRKEEKQWKS